MGQAVLARGTRLHRKIAGVYTVIPELGDVPFPGGSREEIDTTTQDSPSGSKEFIGGDIDYGEDSYEFNFIPGNAVHDQLVADGNGANNVLDWQIKYFGETKFCTFQAYVKLMKVTGPVSGVYRGTLTLRFTGPSVFS